MLFRQSTNIHIYIFLTQFKCTFRYNFYSTFKYQYLNTNLFFAFRRASVINLVFFLFSFFLSKVLHKFNLFHAHEHTYIHIQTAAFFNDRKRSLIPWYFLRDPRRPGRWRSARNRFRVRFLRRPLLRVVFLFLHLLANRLVQVVEFLRLLARYWVFRFRANERRLTFFFFPRSKLLDRFIVSRMWKIEK